MTARKRPAKRKVQSLDVRLLCKEYPVIPWEKPLVLLVREYRRVERKRR
jgi:hypothetical protein